MNGYLQAIKRFNINLRFFYAATAVHGFVFFGIYTLLLNLYLLRLGYGPKFIGLVNGVAPLVLASFSLPAGVISRRIGSRRALMIGYLGVSVGFGLLPLSEFVPMAIRESWIVLAYAGAWLSGALVIVNYSPFIMAETAVDQRSYAFAIQAALFPVSGFLGNLLGGVMPSFFARMGQVDLSSPLPYRNALLFGAFLYLFSVLLMSRTQETRLAVNLPSEQTSKRSVAPIKVIGVIALISLLIVAGEWTMRVYLNVYLDTVLAVPTARIGGLTAVGQLLGLTALTSPFIIGRWGKRRTIIMGTVILSIAFIPLILVAHWMAVGFSFMLLIATSSVINPAFNIFSQSLVLPRWRTTMASGISMSTGLAIAMTALVGSVIILNFGFQTLFVIGAFIILLAAISFTLYFFKNWGQEDLAPAANLPLLESGD